MNVELLHIAVVVTATSHNPSILHPSFLRAEGIVPSDWETSEAPVSTPGVAAVKYTNGVTFAVDPSKLQVVDNKPTWANPLLPELAERYVSTLPKTPYTGVGINPTAFIETDEGGEYVIERFLKRGPWGKPDRNLMAAGVRLVYETSSWRLRLNISAGSIRALSEDARERNGMILEGNYHQEISGDDRSSQVRRALSRFLECLSDFQKTVNDVVLQESNAN